MDIHHNVTITILIWIYHNIIDPNMDVMLLLYLYKSTDPNMDIRPLGVCVNALASGLKSFFKLIPESLISESMGNQLLTVASKCVHHL